MGVIFFGIGEILEEQYSNIDFSQVVCLADNNIQKHNTVCYGKKIIKPININKEKFNQIVIFSNKYFSEIYSQLVNILKIPEWKITSWYFYIKKSETELIQQQKFAAWKSVEGIALCIRLKKIKFLLDFGQELIRFDVLNKQDPRLKNEEFLLDSYNISNKIYSSYYNLYEKIYTHKAELVSRYYDAFIFLNPFLHLTLSKCKKYIRETMELSEYVLLNIPWLNEIYYKEWNEKAFQEFGEVEVVAIASSKFLMIKKKKIENDLVKIYVVTHKRFDFPKSKNYIPICAGANGRADFGYIRDDVGDNISFLNPWINECTALYWIWKNETCKYIGLNHYRRYFLKDKVSETINNALDELTIRKDLVHYDVLLARAEGSYPERNVKQVILSRVMKEAYETGLKNIRRLMLERQPDYVESFDFVMESKAFYPCNMFVMKKLVLDEYCEWLFSFLIDAARVTNIKIYDEYSSRIIGFFAERMLTVWLMHHQLRIKEFPILSIL